MGISGNAVTGLSPDQQQLASWPDLTKRRGANDGLESTGHAMLAAQRPAYDMATADENGVAKNPTLETITDATLLFRVVDGLARSQERIKANRWAIDTFCRRVRQNIPFSYLEKIPNQAIWVAKLPNGITRERSGSTPCKADDLCNKLVATLEADPMRPSPISSVDSEAAEQAAALASEYLRQVMGEAGINWEDKHRWAVDVALTCGSAFLLYDVDRTGGGYQALQKLAHPQATDVQNPKVAVDPPTGVEIPAVDPVLRYVSAPTPEAPAGQFVTDASQADRVWLPKPTCERVRRERVTLFPPTADIENADAAIVYMWRTLSEGVGMFPETLGKMDATELQALASWRPSIGQDITVPYALRSGLSDGASGPTVEEVGSLSPLLQRRFFWYRLYIKSTPEYPSGLRLDISGQKGGLLLDRQTMEYTVTLPKDGTTTRCRDIPLEQVRPCQDVDGGDPTGWPFILRLAGGSDAEATLYAAYQDAINLRLNPHVFIRSTAAVDDDDWADRSTPIVLNPTDPEPTYEQFSNLPGEFLPMIENVDRKLDSAASLGETGQGLETRTAVSGIAKQVTVQQANKDVSGMLHQLNSAKTRGCRILCQLAQAEFDVPQLMQYTGEDGSVQTEWWTGENLAGVDDIGVEPGTGTTMTPEGKAQLAQFAQTAQWLSPSDAAKVGLAGVSRDLGLPPDPVVEAIERAVGTWLKGPPKGWMEQYQAQLPQQQAYDAAQAAFQSQSQAYNQGVELRALSMAGPPQPIGPEQQNAQAGDQYAKATILLQSGQYPMAPPSPVQVQPPPPMWTPFQPRPNDTEPKVAAKWEERLSVAQMSPEYSRHPQPWKDVLNTFYTQERQAVAMATQPQAPAPAGKPAQGAPQGNPQGPQGAIKPTLPAHQPGKAA